jgi:hypothetical protein
MNPSHEALKQANETAAAIERLRERVDATSIYAPQLEFHSETLASFTAFLERTDHTISFIGPTSVGKTTVICRMLNLIQDSIPILAVGAGHTTISEVHVISGPDYGIAIDPLPDEEVMRYVDEFAEYLLILLQAETSDISQSVDSRELILSPEVERCLRNMCELQRKHPKVDGTIVSIDTALDLARKIQDQDALRAEIWSRMNMPMRKETELICDVFDEDKKKKWLKRNFLVINNGRHPGFGIPSRITVIVPDALIDIPEYRITVVDTKGIDQTSQRADIERQLKDERNLNIFCSSFPDAPDEGTVGILRRARESGIGNRLTTETCILVLPRNDEASNVNGSDGEPVGDKELGYKMKRGEIIPTLVALGLRDDYALYFHDDRKDTPEGLKNFVKNRIAALRGYYVKRIEEVAKAVAHVESNLENVIARTAFRHVIDALQAWVKECRDGMAAVKTVHKSLLESLRDSNTHSSSVRASVIRKGRWGNMDFYFKIGYDSRVQAAVSIHDLIQKFSIVTENILRQSNLAPAHSFVQELRHYIDMASENLYKEMEQIGLGIFEKPMEQGADWKNMGEEWGRGPGYKVRIMSHADKWFKEQQQVDRLNLFRKRLRDGWLKLLVGFEEKLKGAIPG